MSGGGRWQIELLKTAAGFEVTVIDAWDKSRARLANIYKRRGSALRAAALWIRRCEAVSLDAASRRETYEKGLLVRK